MGVIVKLGKTAFNVEDTDKGYEFQSDLAALASFGRTLICTDLMDVLEDWISGCREEYRLHDLSQDSYMIARIQGREDALINFKQFLDNLKTIDHIFDEELNNDSKC
jgi:hypothetical protein